VAKEVASHLIELGHRDIAMVFPPLEGNDRARGRFEGAVEELRLHYPDQPRITEARYSISDGKNAVEAILTAPALCLFVWQ
jgi:LacI family transcriptional regulator